MNYYIKQAMTRPKEIYVGRNMKNSHFFSIILLLATALTFLSLFEFYPAFRNMNSDITEVKQAIPEFTLENNQLESPSDSFVYQTDTLLLYFDPDNKISTDTITQNMNSVSVPLSVGLLKNELTLSLMDQNFTLQYADLSNFTTEDLKSLIDSFGQFSPTIILFFILFLFIYNLMIYLFQLFPIILFANIVSVYRRTGLRFLQTAKISLLATILPILGLYTVNAFLFNVYFHLEILIVSSVIIYYSSITEMKNRIKNHQITDE